MGPRLVQSPASVQRSLELGFDSVFVGFLSVFVFFRGERVSEWSTLKLITHSLFSDGETTHSNNSFVLYYTCFCFPYDVLFFLRFPPGVFSFFCLSSAVFVSQKVQDDRTATMRG